MEYRELGSTRVRASVIGFGCNRIAAPGGDRDKIVATLEAALDVGINLFDTADSYDNGDSERMLGRVFQSRRDKIVLCSKAGYRSWIRVALESWIPMPGYSQKGSTPQAHKSVQKRVALPSRRNYAPRILTLGIERSLRRLQTDYLDFFYLHSPPPEIVATQEVFEALEKLKSKGWIRHYGVSFSEDTATRLVLDVLPHPGISVVQFRVNPLESVDVRQIVSENDRGIGLIARQPYQRGAVFGSEWITNATASQPRTAAQNVLRSVLQQDGVQSVLVGMRSRKHLEENLGALQGDPLSPEEMAQLYSRTNIH